jgi:hypothetical protein
VCPPIPTTEPGRSFAHAAGPGQTAGEGAVTALGLAIGLSYVHLGAPASWTTVQYGTAQR